MTAARAGGLTIGLCFLVAVIDGFDIQAAGVAAPRLAPALGLTAGALGLFFSSSTLGMLVGAYAGGWASDRVGRKPVLLAAIAVFGVFSILTGAAGGVGVLVAMRLLTGVGLGAALPSLIALAAESNPDRRARAVAMMYAGTPLGGAIAGVASVVLPTWQAIFHLGGLLPLVVLPVLWWFLPESHVPRAVDAPMQPVGTIVADGRGTNTALLWLAFFAGMLVLYLMLNWTPLMLAARGFPAGQIALFQATLNIVGGLSVLLVAQMLDGRRQVRIAVVAYFASALALALLSITPPMLIPVLIVAALLGGGLLTAQSILYSTAPLLYPEAIRGTGVGAAVAVGRTGSVLGPVIGAGVLGVGIAPATLPLLIVPVMLLSGLCNVAVLRRLKRRDPEISRLATPIA